ncbi:MAG: nickel-dependent lactate racemase [Chloroflexota bacterium]
MTTEFYLPYGDGSIRAGVPARNLRFVLETADVPGLSDERAAIVQALRNPIGAKPLRDSVTRGDKIVVLTTDNTRACPDDRLLPPILSELECSVRRKDITILVALGLHRPLDNHELAGLLGRDIVENYTVLNHDAEDVSYIGRTSRDTPVEINNRVLEADFIVSTGFIEPHFFAGFSGGRKSIAPGVFSRRSAYVNHGYRMIADPRSCAGILDGNPIHEDMVEQALMARLGFIVNVLLNQERQITHVVAGDPTAAHEKGCELERQVAGVHVDGEVDVTITTNSGAPLDLDLYQTVKGMDNASLITREGGVVIIASSCSDGVGPQQFVDLHASASSPTGVLEKIEREEPIGVQWQNQILARTQLNNEIYLLCGLEDRLVEQVMVTPISSVEEGLDRAFHKLGRDARVAVIPEGPLVLPLLAHANA